MMVKRLLFSSALLLAAGTVSAAYTTLGDMADAFFNMHLNVGQLLIGLGYLSGVGFGIASVYKFKQYKDNPTQIPIGTPFALLMVSIMMVSMPGLINIVTMTIFGEQSASEICRGLPGGDACP